MNFCIKFFSITYGSAFRRGGNIWEIEWNFLGECLNAKFRDFIPTFASLFVLSLLLGFVWYSPLFFICFWFTGKGRGFVKLFRSSLTLIFICALTNQWSLPVWNLFMKLHIFRLLFLYIFFYCLGLWRRGKLWSILFMSGQQYDSALNSSKTIKRGNLTNIVHHSKVMKR